MSNAHTFHVLMLMSWSPGDGSGTPCESPAKLRKKSNICDANEKNGSRTLARGTTTAVRSFFKALLVGISGVVFNKYVMNALTRKVSKQETVVLLLDRLEFVAGVNRVTSLCGDMRHLPTLVDMLKDPVQVLGSRDVTLDAAINFTEKGLHILVNSGDDQVSVQHRYSKKSSTPFRPRCG